MTRNTAHERAAHPLRGHKRIRAVRGGRVVVDTLAPVLVWEWPYYPTYHLPVADVYLDAYKTMMLGFYGQRCGTAVALAAENASFAHGVCHTGSVDLQYFDGAGPTARLFTMPSPSPRGGRRGRCRRTSLQPSTARPTKTSQR